MLLYYSAWKVAVALCYCYCYCSSIVYRGREGSLEGGLCLIDQLALWYNFSALLTPARGRSIFSSRDGPRYIFFRFFFFLFGNLQLSSGGVYSAPSMGRGEGGTLWLQRGSLPCRKRKKSMNTSVGKVGRYKVVILSQACRR